MKIDSKLAGRMEFCIRKEFGIYEKIGEDIVWSINKLSPWLSPAPLPFFRFWQTAFRLPADPPEKQFCLLTAASVRQQGKTLPVVRCTIPHWRHPMAIPSAVSTAVFHYIRPFSLIGSFPLGFRQLHCLSSGFDRQLFDDVIQKLDAGITVEELKKQNENW